MSRGRKKRPKITPGARRAVEMASDILIELNEELPEEIDTAKAEQLFRRFVMQEVIPRSSHGKETTEKTISSILAACVYVTHRQSERKALVSRPRLQEHFGVSRGAVQWWIEKVYKYAGQPDWGESE